MPVTWSKEEKVVTNPLSGTTESIFEVYNIWLDGTTYVAETFCFEITETDPEIQNHVEETLAGEGYTWK
jgi:hypothetical protein